MHRVKTYPSEDVATNHNIIAAKMIIKLKRQRNCNKTPKLIDVITLRVLEFYCS